MTSHLTVPAAMLAAFKSGRGPQPYRDFSRESREYALSLASVLHWLESVLESKRPPNETAWQAGYNSAISDVLQIFQTNPAVDKIKHTLAGCTLTRAEAAEITELVNLCVASEKEL